MSKKINFVEIICLTIVCLAIFRGVDIIYDMKDRVCQKEEQQKDCQHEWSVIDSCGIMKTIYCPKCKTEDDVSSKTWEKMQVDEKYQTETN